MGKYRRCFDAYAERDRFEVEYALRGIEKPVGVSEFRLTRELPAELINILPDPKELEEKIKREIAINDVLPCEGVV